MSGRALVLMLVAGAIVGAACVEIAPFVCSESADCKRSGIGGRCEPTHYCAYPDGSCESGYRYSDLAGPFARECTEPEIADDSSAGADTATATASGESEDTASGDDAVRERCGDGHVDAGEGCDDGNELDGDECSSDCFANGELVWEALLPGATGSNARFDAVVVLGDGAVIAGGYEVRPDEIGATQDAVLRRYDASGAEAWTRWFEQMEDDDNVDRVRDLAERAGGGLLVSFESGADNFDLRTGVAKYTTDDGERTDLAWIDDCPPEGLALLDPGIVAVGSGYRQGRGWLQRFDDDLEPVAHTLKPGTQPEDGLRGMAVDKVSGRVFATGSFGGHAIVGEWIGDDLVTLWELEEPSRGQDLAFSPDGWLALVGFRRPTLSDCAFVDVRDTGGAPRWAWDKCSGTTDAEVEAVDFDGAGNLFVAGLDVIGDMQTRVWAFGPEGEKRWSWMWPEPLPGQDSARDIDVTLDGASLLVVGVREAEGEANDEDAWIVRLEP